MNVSSQANIKVKTSQSTIGTNTNTSLLKESELFKGIVKNALLKDQLGRNISKRFNGKYSQTEFSIQIEQPKVKCDVLSNVGTMVIEATKPKVKKVNKLSVDDLVTELEILKKQSNKPPPVVISV